MRQGEANESAGRAGVGLRAFFGGSPAPFLASTLSLIRLAGLLGRAADVAYLYVSVAMRHIIDGRR
jgi:hypothetical protein